MAKVCGGIKAPKKQTKTSWTKSKKKNTSKKKK